MWPGLEVGRKGHGLHAQLPAISYFPASNLTILSSLLNIVHDCKALGLLLVLVLCKQGNLLTVPCVCRVSCHLPRLPGYAVNLMNECKRTSVLLKTVLVCRAFKKTKQPQRAWLAQDHIQNIYQS